MQFIYILHLSPFYSNASNWTTETNSIMEQHWNYLVNLHEQGIIQLVGRTNYEPGHKDLMGICVFTADNETKASDIMRNDPCVAHGVMTAAVHAFNLSLLEGRELKS